MDNSKNIKGEPLMDKKYIPLLIVLITAIFLWKMIVYGRNNPMGNSIDQTDPVNSIGNRADEYFNNPR